MRAILAADLEPISFDDLPLGGEWTTRRRTISESEIALFAGVAGDFSPQTIDGARPQGRMAPPALLIAVAIGLGTMDMPVPSIAEWGWTNWKFPRPVRAGETVYARWTLTQKRPHKPGDPTAIAVWRVDVHTSDGAMCAEGEVGASVNRSSRQQQAASTPAPAVGAAVATTTPRRRRGRKSPAKPAAQALAPEPAPPPVETAPATQTEKTGSRRRRRRRPKSSHGGNGQPAADSSPEPPPPAAAEPARAPVVAAPSRGQAASPLSRVIKRLRRPSGGA